MKKNIAILSLVVVFALLAASCSHKTCPAYRGSIGLEIRDSRRGMLLEPIPYSVGYRPIF